MGQRQDSGADLAREEDVLVTRVRPWDLQGVWGGWLGVGVSEEDVLASFFPRVPFPACAHGTFKGCGCGVSPCMDVKLAACRSGLFCSSSDQRFSYSMRQVKFRRFGVSRSGTLQHTAPLHQ